MLATAACGDARLRFATVARNNRLTYGAVGKTGGFSLFQVYRDRAWVYSALWQQTTRQTAIVC